MPDNDAAWHRNSAQPGKGSNIVISGHNASTGGRVFAELEDLKVGDEIMLWNEQDEAHPYQVVEKKIIRTLLSSETAQEFLRTVTNDTPDETININFLLASLDQHTSAGCDSHPKIIAS